jgi:hypothetical protein
MSESLRNLALGVQGSSGAITLSEHDSTVALKIAKRRGMKPPEDAQLLTNSGAVQVPCQWLCKLMEVGTDPVMPKPKAQQEKVAWEPDLDDLGNDFASPPAEDYNPDPEPETPKPRRGRKPKAEVTPELPPDLVPEDTTDVETEDAG